MTHARIAAALSLAVALSGTACSIEINGDDTIVREERRFPVTGEPDLQVETFDGSVQVRSWDRSEVLVQIERHGRDREEAAALEVTVLQNGNRVRVHAEQPSKRSGVVLGGSRSVSFIISVPHAARVFVRSGDGAINVDDVTGRIELHSQDGSIRAARVVGDVIVETGDGSVHVDGQLAVLRTTTQDGSISVDATAGSTAREDWEIGSGDGSITVNVPDRFDADVEARTGDGSISISGIPQTDDDQRSVRGRFGRGGHVLKVHSGDGSIRISRR
jgi:hypothetical protein